MTSMMNIDPKTAVKDPLASCNIPQIIEDKKLDIDGKATTYKRGSLLGKVNTIVCFLNEAFLNDFLLHILH